MDVTENVLEVIAMVIKKDVEYVRENQNVKLWDSFTRVELVFALEEKFNKRFSPDQIVQMDTAEHIIEVIK